MIHSAQLIFQQITYCYSCFLLSTLRVSLGFNRLLNSLLAVTIVIFLDVRREAVINIADFRHLFTCFQVVFAILHLDQCMALILYQMVY